MYEMEKKQKFANEGIGKRFDEDFDSPQ